MHARETVLFLIFLSDYDMFQETSHGVREQKCMYESPCSYLLVKNKCNFDNIFFYDLKL